MKITRDELKEIIKECIIQEANYTLKHVGDSWIVVNKDTGFVTSTKFRDKKNADAWIKNSKEYNKDKGSKLKNIANKNKENMKSIGNYMKDEPAKFKSSVKHHKDKRNY